MTSRRAEDVIDEELVCDRENIGWRITETEPGDENQAGSRDVEIRRKNTRDRPHHKPPVTNFGKIEVKTSNEIYIGGKTFYNGPVTVEQFWNTSPAQSNNSTLAKPRLDKPNEEENPSVKKRSCLISPYFIGGVVALILVCSLITAYLFAHYTSHPKDYDDLPMNASLRMVNRSEWGADQPQKTEPLATPVKYAIVLHTAGRFCHTEAECSDVVRMIQSGYLNRKMNDVPYSFLIGGDGLIYEGRGWDLRGAFAGVFNNCSIGVGFIGTFAAVPPPIKQLDALSLLLDEGVRLGKLPEDYGLLLHSQVSVTDSPGQQLSARLQTWPHWVDCEEELCQC